MAQPLAEALDVVRAALTDPDGLLRAVGAGRRRSSHPQWRRVELRYVDLKAGRALQVVRYTETQALTENHPIGEAASAAVTALLSEPFGNWHVETSTATLQVRVTKSGEAVVSRTAGKAVPADVDRSHDRQKNRLLAEDDPVLIALGISDPQGRIKPSRRAKYRQIEEFVRELAATVGDVLASGRLTATQQRPLRIVDLGCGNAYLTFAAHAWLRSQGIPVELIGVDVKDQSYAHNSAVAASLDVADQVRFVVGTIADVDLPDPPDVVLALHACDTATDEALARAVAWKAPVILAAPCCHRDLSRQLRAPASGDQPGLTGVLRDGILRERLADTLTDALRAGLLREHGYRVEVVEFVESQHTPRNSLLRAVATGADPARAEAEVAEILRTWPVRPRLAALLAGAGG